MWDQRVAAIRSMTAAPSVSAIAASTSWSAVAMSRVTFGSTSMPSPRSRRTRNTRFGERLRALGFSEDSLEGAPLCRWIRERTILDVVPRDENILGFSNRWYKDAVKSAATRNPRPILKSGSDFATSNGAAPLVIEVTACRIGQVPPVVVDREVEHGGRRFGSTILQVIWT
jgi:hypothetical protein